MKKKHYLVYKTTCLLNGKIYIGQHQTYDLNDGYIGSGYALNDDIEKFGRENFNTEILFDFDNFTDMDNKERELVNESFIARTDTYNIILGGANGLVSITPELRAKANKTRWANLSEDERRHYIEAANAVSRGRKHTQEELEKMSAFMKKHLSDPTKNGMYGRKHSLASRMKMRDSHVGERNNQYGKMWICNDLTHESKTIMKTEPIPEGWRKGRFC